MFEILQNEIHKLLAEDNTLGFVKMQYSNSGDVIYYTIVSLDMKMRGI